MTNLMKILKLLAEKLNSKSSLYDRSSTYLSAILAHIGLAPHNRPDVVIQTPITCHRQWHLVRLRVKYKQKQEMSY